MGYMAGTSDGKDQENTIAIEFRIWVQGYPGVVNGHGS